jgi:ribosome-associated toxin RatA of RatAB toxin-antitoxin module
VLRSKVLTADETEVTAELEVGFASVRERYVVCLLWLPLRGDLLLSRD